MVRAMREHPIVEFRVWSPNGIVSGLSPRVHSCSLPSGTKWPLAGG